MDKVGQAINWTVANWDTIGLVVATVVAWFAPSPKQIRAAKKKAKAK